MAERMAHGIEWGCFDNMVPCADGSPRRVLVCLCGYRALALTWEEAGADLDAHHEAQR